MDDSGVTSTKDSSIQLITKQDARDFIEEKIDSTTGLRLSVYVIGDRRRPAIITFHDLGLNANSSFQSFFQFSEMSVIGDKYCVYHINAPGQEEDAEPIPDSIPYPSMDELANMIGTVTEHFKLKTFIGFGVGVGANLLCRYALKNPKAVDGLILVNCSSGTSGWVEWGYQKANIYYLRNKGMTNLTVDYLMWHNFGRNLDECSVDLVQSYKQYFSKIQHARNLAAFIESYAKRTDLGLRRDGLTLQYAFHIIVNNIELTFFRQPVLLIVGSGSAHMNESVDMNAKLNPARSNWMKISECSGLVLEEKADKVAEAILLFLQGLGHFPTMSHLKWRQSRTGSICSMRSNSICIPDTTSTQREFVSKETPIREAISEENLCDATGIE